MIQHQMTVKASVEKTTAALSTISGLSNWWTREVTGNAEPGSELQFHNSEVDLEI